MEREPELFPTVFRETLWGKQYFDRISELEAAGAKIETQEVGGSNGEWIIIWRKATGKNPAGLSTGGILSDAKSSTPKAWPGSNPPKLDIQSEVFPDQNAEPAQIVAGNIS